MDHSSHAFFVPVVKRFTTSIIEVTIKQIALLQKSVASAHLRFNDSLCLTGFIMTSFVMNDYIFNALLLVHRLNCGNKTFTLKQARKPRSYASLKLSPTDRVTDSGEV